MALGELEERLGKNLTIVTQNVDDLHERGGSKNVLHMHGSLLSAKCPVSQKSSEITQELNSQSYCECCEVAQAMRPDIVWFGEVPYHIEKQLYEADLFVSIGTSGNVYPAAGFVSFANQMGAYTLELNLEPTSSDSDFMEKRYGRASELVPAFVKECLVAMK
jgi:NAD-dependent deacetylase